MVSVSQSARSATASYRSLSLGIALGTLVSCGLVGGAVWSATASFRAVQAASRALSEDSLRLSSTLALADPRLRLPVPEAGKASRVQRPSESEISQSRLTVEAIRLAQARNQAAELARAEKRLKAEEETRRLASLTPAPVAEAEKPSLATALVEDVPVNDFQPFDLVLARPPAEDEDMVALPSDVPLPAERPLFQAALGSQAPVIDTRPPRSSSNRIEETAVAKPERTLFGELFKRKTGSGGWTGNDKRVAIYDVSNATVYMPDGTRLRAHSGIGAMRDNPRYDHVSMRGPTPSGIYRLSMREKRFYGVEAIRMTSIDGRNPKNRTGLLTHTNLLRGQTGSHGCVAFQNYEPFLKAFKRGDVRTLVVVPELPSSTTELASLYRKAGA